MSCGKTTCKYYDHVINGRCTFEGNECINGSKYISMYACDDCIHFDIKAIPLKRCSVLLCTGGGAPCEHPRIKKDGTPVMCTFYKKRGLSNEA